MMTKGARLIPADALWPSRPHDSTAPDVSLYQGLRADEPSGRRSGRDRAQDFCFAPPRDQLYSCQRSIAQEGAHVIQMREDSSPSRPDLFVSNMFVLTKVRHA